MEEKEFTLDSVEDLDIEVLEEMIQRHKALAIRYQELIDLYTGKHKILSGYRDIKESYKPDNRLVVNFAKYIVDTFNGFFMGRPVVTSHDNEAVNNYVQLVEGYNSIDNNNAELSKMCSIFGHAYEIIFADEEAQIGIKAVDPREGFIIYDNSIRAKPLFGVRYRVNKGNVIEGSISDDKTIRYFTDDKEFKFTEEKTHYFQRVPMVEYVENAERQGAFENVETLINAYNKAISEKANDVDYFADAYMKILGAKLDDETLERIKSNRIINMSGADTDKLIVGFMEKPNADTTQENLINRLENLIFTISMVANINDEKFGTSSGIALKYKLQSMTNLANTKERKFVQGFTQRYLTIANYPASKISAEDVVTLHYAFTKNIPNNLSEEADTALKLKNVVSEETAIRTLSIVEDVKGEIEKIKEEDRFDNPYDRENHGVDLDEERTQRDTEAN